jgi:hypothetical protein
MMPDIHYVESELRKGGPQSLLFESQGSELEIGIIIDLKSQIGIFKASKADERRGNWELSEPSY